MIKWDMKTHIVADKLVCLKVGQKLVVEVLLCHLPIQVFWVVLMDSYNSDFTHTNVFIHLINVESCNAVVPYLPHCLPQPQKSMLLFSSTNFIFFYFPIV